QHHVLVYMEDAIKQLLEHKEENPKVNPTKFFCDYFISVREGNHVMFREFTFVEATPHNRASFVRTFWKCFRNIGRKGDLLSIREYHSLVCLLCADFPFKIIQKTARIILMDDAMDCLISFSDFLYAFQVQFFYGEFLTECADVYKDVLQNPQTNHETVVVPTSEESPSPPVTQSMTQSSAQTASLKSEGVDAMQFYRGLVPASEKPDFCAIPLTILKDIFTSVERVTFYGFLMALAKSEALNQSIGMKIILSQKCIKSHFTWSSRKSS
ncbi:hypothetical protein CAPTEDRAFT_138684, partial [Capitella teleta]